MKRTSISASIFVVALFVASCSSTDKSPRIDRATPVIISVVSDDAVVSGNVSPEMARNFGNTISKLLVAGLQDRGISCELAPSSGSNKATVKVDLTGIHGESHFDAGPFGASTKSLFKVSYNATLTSADGTRLFRFDGRESNRVLGELTSEVGNYVAKRVAKHYKTAK